MPKLSISLAQMQITFGEPNRNLTTFQRMAAEAGRRKSSLVVFPELWATGYTLENAKDYASEINKGLFLQISQVATQARIAIVGSLLEKRGPQIANSAPFFGPNGAQLGIYRKIHLFKNFHEDQYLQPGSTPLTLDLPWGPTSFAICYDLRFPELFRRYATQERARIILIPAEWPLARIDHWRHLLIARAIENQCFVVGVNSVGQTGDQIFGGHSMIVNPWGKIIVEAGESPQLLTGEIELDEIDEVRERISALSDLRLDIYG